MIESLNLQVFVGIDPGSSSGSIAWIIVYPSGKVEYDVVQMSKMTEKDIADKFKELKSYVADGGHIKAIIERVWGNPKMGSKACFVFGGNYHAVRMAMICNGIPFDDPTPKTWQKYYNMGKKGAGETQAEWKRRLQQKAEQIFPNIKVLRNTADALLVSHYCMMIYK